MVHYRLVGTGVTDGNGVAHMTKDATGSTVSGYTGVGAGKIDFVCSVEDPDHISSSVQSTPYEVTDCLYYDKALSGTGNYNDAMWHKYYATLERGSDGSVVTASNNWGEIRVGTTSSAQAISLPVVIEFDLIEMSEIGDTGPYIYARNFDENRSWFITEVLGHHRLEIRSNSQTQTVDGQSKPSGSVNLGETIRFGMGSTTANGTIKFKNFKVYPI